jgi:hypothetical protein
MRRFLFVTTLVLAIALLIGCSSTVEAPAGQEVSEPTGAAAVRATAAQELAPEPTDTATPAATKTAAGQVEEPAGREPATTEPVATEPAPTPEPPTATTTPQINGRYEETYYRGLATAPITMIDYSDFL